jgi:isoamyl acetate esterase
LGDAAPQVKILTLWFGANDACAPTGLAGDQHVPLDEFVSALEQIIDYVVLKAHHTKIILLTPPPVDEHQFDAVNPRKAILTAQYAAAVRDLAARSNLPLVDVWTMFAAEAGLQQSLSVSSTMLPGSKLVPPVQCFRELLWDGLHLSTKAYQLVFAELMLTIRRDMPELAPENLPLEICKKDDSLHIPLSVC